MTKSSKKACTDCSCAVEALKGVALKRIAKKLSGWKLVKNHHLEREYKFKNFLQALKFTNKVGALAEKEQHHPDFYLAWGKVKLTLWTHKVDGLTGGDFIFAAKINKLGG